MKMTRCILANCINRRGKVNEDVRMHSLPKSREERQKWIKFVRTVNGENFEVNKTARVCSAHFHACDKNTKKLKARAVPSIVTPVSNEEPDLQETLVRHESAGNGGDVPIQGNLDVPLFSSVLEINLAAGENKNKEPDLHEPLICHQSSGSVHGVQIQGNSDVSPFPLVANMFPNVLEFNPRISLNGNEPNVAFGNSQNEALVFSSANLFHEGLQEIVSYESYSSVVEIETVSSQTAADYLLDIPQKKQQELCAAARAVDVECNSYDDYSCVVEIELPLPGKENRSKRKIDEKQATEVFGFGDDRNNNKVFLVEFEDTCGIEQIDEDLPEEGDARNNGNTQTNQVPGARKPQRKCCIKKCAYATKTLHTFPAIIIDGQINNDNLERCKQWVKMSGNKSLLSIPSASLYKNYFICSVHFRDDQYFNALNRSRLLPTAVPTENIEQEISRDEMNVFPFYRAEDVIDHIGLVNDSNNNFDKLQREFERTMNSLQWRTCYMCKEAFFVKASSTVKCLHGKRCQDFSTMNDMDPGDVPEELKGLTYIEELLIALIHPVVSVFKLKAGHQYGYKGNIINFPQNVNDFAKQLPHALNDLTAVITIRTGTDVEPVDFHVRHSKVKAALLWLKENNVHYRYIEISEENLSALPTDGNIYDQFYVNEPNAEDDNERNDDPTEESSEHGDIYESCIPMLGQPTDTDHYNTILNWPSKENAPINEFTTIGYVVKAFPCLFPRGVADLRSPRTSHINEQMYFKHFMRYHDRRFAQHPRFRFFAYNSMIRWRALHNAGIFVKRNEDLENLTTQQLRVKLKEDPNFIKKLMFQNANIQGTRPFWLTRSKELLAMCEQLGLPTLFFTFSCADFHWPELFQILSPSKSTNDLTERDRRKLIEDNPMIVDEFFHVRVNTFINEVLQKKYNIQDIWFRTEYQHRGSPHVHGVMWLKDAPDVSNLMNASEEEKQKTAEYFNQLVSAFNPSRNAADGAIHPSRVRMSEVNNLTEDLASLLNTVQRHTQCSEGYCLRINRTTKKRECRFKFPVEEMEDKARIVVNEDNTVEFFPRRNDPRLAKHNAYMMQTWRANMDVSPVLSKRALVTYLTKYITKAETKSKEFDGMLKTVLENAKDDTSASSVIRRLFIQMCSERDYSAQEVCHSLMGWKMYQAGARKFVNLYFKSNDGDDDWIPIEDGNTRQKSFVEKYQQRPNTATCMCLWQVAKEYALPSMSIHRKTAIVKVCPQYKLYEPPCDKNEQYYKQQVLLFVPWRSIDDLGDMAETWKSKFERLKETIDKNREDQVGYANVQPEVDEYEPGQLENTSTCEQWMFVSQMGANNVTQMVELGKRDLDIQHDWHSSALKYEKYGGIPALRSFISCQKKNIQNTPEEISIDPDVVWTAEQGNILNMLKIQLKTILNQSLPQNFSVPKRILVQGKAGTGKSLLIRAMRNMIINVLGNDAAIFLGPTGVSALNVSGSTIHSILKIDMDKKHYEPFHNAEAHEFRRAFEKVKFVFIDEYSMVGCRMMHRIDQRLREAKGCPNDEFGKAFIYFFGDVKQLSPPFDTPVYSENQQSYEATMGKLLYESFDCAAILSQVKRQNAGPFQDVLNNISTGNVSLEDYHILKERFNTTIPETERKTFDNAMHLYPTNAEAFTHNKAKLARLRHPTTNQPVPVARIPAKHFPRKQAATRKDDFEGLAPILYVAEGAKIMLRANVWTERGLVNGSVGEIVDIIYDEKAIPQEEQPAVLICRFKSYKGPFLDNEEKTVPIVPLTKYYEENEQSCSITNFPISIAYACTVHKSQGLSLDKVVVKCHSVNVKGRVIPTAPGLIYTALSRARTLQGLLLEPFPYSALSSLNDRPFMKQRQNWEESLQRKLLPIVLPEMMR